MKKLVKAMEIEFNELEKQRKNCDKHNVKFIIEAGMFYKKQVSNRLKEMKRQIQWDFGYQCEVIEDNYIFGSVFAFYAYGVSEELKESLTEWYTRFKYFYNI